MENLYRSIQNDIKMYRKVPVSPSASMQSSILIWMNTDVQKHMTRLPKDAVTFFVRPPNDAGVERYLSLLSRLSDSRRQSTQLKTFEHPFFLTCNSHLLEMTVQIVEGKLDKTCIHHSAAFHARERETEEATRQKLEKARAKAFVPTPGPAAEQLTAAALRTKKDANRAISIGRTSTNFRRRRTHLLIVC
jgi:hypothetical protein